MVKHSFYISEHSQKKRSHVVQSAVGTLCPMVSGVASNRAYEWLPTPHEHKGHRNLATW